jgi:hypothetical protein
MWWSRIKFQDGTTYKYNSSNYAAIQQGQLLFIDLGNLVANEADTITYILHTQNDIWSERLFLDDVPDTNNLHWTPATLGATAVNTWGITDTLSANTGNYTWAIKEITDKSQQALIMDPNAYSFHVTGQKPALRFYHRYDTQAGLNGGMVEVRVVGETNWEAVGDEMIRNGYKRQVDYRTFLTTGLNAFSGNSGDVFQATYVDLSKWADQDIQVRFRFGTFTNTHTGTGWCIDDIEFMNLRNYNEYVCVNSDQGDFECAIAPEMGTIIDSRWDPVSGTETPEQLAAFMYPNPASDVFTIAFSLDKPQAVNVSVFTLDGLLVASKPFDCAGQSLLNINTMNLPSGIYMIKLSSGEGQYVQKLVIQH